MKIKNLGDRAEIYIYGTIIDDTDAKWMQAEDGSILGYQFPADIRQQLKDVENLPLLVRISSYGGDVSAAVAIFNMLKEHNAPVTVQIDSIAASAASIIAMAGNEIIMPENSFLMIHNPQGGGFGTSDYLLSIVDYLKKLRDMIAGTYEKHVKNGADVKALMDAETWINAHDAEEMFDNVRMVDSNDIKAVAKFDVHKLDMYKNVPDALKEQLKVVDTATEEAIEAEDAEGADDDADNNNVVVETILEVLKRSFAK